MDMLTRTRGNQIGRRGVRRRLALALAGLVVGCGELEPPADDLGAGTDESAVVVVEEAYPGESGARELGMFPVNGVPQMLEFERLRGEPVMEGDILLAERGDPPEPPTLEAAPPDEPDAVDVSVDELAARTAAGLWPGGVVPYTIDPRLPNPSRVTNAIAHWQARTALRFVRRTSQGSYVTFTTGAGCASSVGRLGGRQYVRLARACSTGSAIHEIGHAVGLRHENQRADRDRHVRVLWDNIDPDRRGNFRTYRELGAAGRDVGEYDTGSIMHYGSTFFSRNGRPTLVTLAGRTISANRSGLSARDIAGVALLYGARR